MRYLITGTIYSDNLGDGIIAENLAAAIRKHRPGAQVILLDTSGRTTYGDVALANKQGAQRVLQMLPTALRYLLVPVAVGFLLVKKLIPRWYALIQPNDAVIIGGGQLFLDFALNFPLKLTAVSLIAHLKGARTAVHAVGVSPGWSLPGKWLFDIVVSNALAISIGVRDTGSQASLARHLNLPPANIRITPDPGLLTARTYLKPKPAGQGVGINLADPRELKLCTPNDNGANTFTAENHLAVWKNVITTLLAQKQTVTLFTNGAHEDRAYLAEVVTHLGATAIHPKLKILPAASTPTQLVNQIAGLKTLIAHRLHANIIAFALGVPAIGLAWDTKLTGFYHDAGLPTHLLQPQQFSAPNILAMLKKVRGKPASAKARKTMADKAEAAIIQLLTRFDA